VVVDSVVLGRLLESSIVVVVDDILVKLGLGCRCRSGGDEVDDDDEKGELGFPIEAAAATMEPVVVVVRWSKNAVDAAVAVVLVVVNAADDGSIVC